MADVVITGGSRGIGAAAVTLFASQGHRVWFLYGNNRQAAEAVSKATGATAIQCDVSDGEAVKTAFQTIGNVDILICSAGISRYGLLQDVTEAEWDRLFDVNVKGMYHCINAATPSFLHKQRGCIITVSSMWGQVGASCEAAYAATKGAVIALTKSMAKELGPSGVQVNCIAPGLIQTDMCANLSQEVLRDMAEETPLGRNGTADDVAQAMLALSRTPFVTGQVLGVNGGCII